MYTDILIFGVSLSALYVLIAIGFTLIFSIGGIANLAHGVFLMLGAYIVALLAGQGSATALALLISALVVGVAAVPFYRIFVRPVENEPLTALIVTLLAGLAIEESVGIITDHQRKSVEPILSGTIDLFGTKVPMNRVLAFAVSWLIILGVFYLVTQSRLGRGILAASIDEKGAASVGINIDRVTYMVWALASGIAAVSGYFFGSFTELTPTMGFDPLLTGFVIVVIGGLGSISGSVVAAYLIGMLETIAAFVIDPAAQGLFSFGILLVILLYRPEGLLGKRELEFE
jgi:branched-chain amino acid transport system permease protein